MNEGTYKYWTKIRVKRTVTILQHKRSEFATKLEEATSSNSYHIMKCKTEYVA